MKSIDVFCHLMPQKYAELAMSESPNKSHMFLRALKMQAMSDMEYRLKILELGRTGSYRHATRCLPTCFDNSTSVSMLSSIEGTPGSIFFPYAVMV